MHPMLGKTTSWIMMVILFLCVQKGQAQTGITLKTVLDGGKNQLVKDAATTVQDSAYFNAALKSKLDTPYQVNNIVTFRINEYANVYLPATFSATLNVRIIFTRPNLTRDSVEKSLVINYDTAKNYNGRSSFVFSKAHQVTLKVLGVTTAVAGVLPALLLENEMKVFPEYKLDCSNDAVKTITSNNPPSTDSTDEITINWPAVSGVDEYDLEWAYIDSTALLSNRYGNPVKPLLIFRNNTTRVTVKENSYKVPLLYDNGGALFFRVRAVQVKGKSTRLTTSWSSDFTGGMGRYNFCGHQRSLNWQSAVSYAEDGKRKAVVQYFDGSLRSRQTVTKDNTTNTAIVGETFYDYQGRPAIQVLPAPSINGIIKYSRSFNTDINGAEYEKRNYDQLSSPTTFLSDSANPMGNGSGAAYYYSSRNAAKGSGTDRFIPDAENYAFTHTEYTPDNTGRISKQSGVGPLYKNGRGHETSYIYASPAQEELDVLFGTEAGDYTHYFKNMVQDANGQYAVSYLDMHGRTVATALAGTPATGMDNLPSNIVVNTTDTLSRPGANVITDREIIMKKSQAVPMEGEYRFRYQLTPPVLQKKDCNGNLISYPAVYDLEIMITDDVYNQRLPNGQPVVKIFKNYTGSLVDFPVTLKKGNYEITKTLRISDEGLTNYRDNVFLQKNLCTSLDQIIQQHRKANVSVNCFADCKSCRDAMGTWDVFRNRYMVQAGIAVTDSAAYRNDALAAYKAALEACDALCEEVPASQDIRKAMLLDVTAPSGQYADPNDSTTFSLLYAKGEGAKPAYKSDDIVYLNAQGKPDLVYNEVTGTYVKPQQLTPEQFGLNFKDSWAETLLKYHPEYCKLLEYEKYQESFKWDLLFAAIDTYSEAKAKGYLNPTANTTAPYNTFPAVIASQDPFARMSAAHKAFLEGKINPAADRTLWSMAATMAFCQGRDFSCAANYATPSTAFNERTMCAGDLNMAWRNFREYYLQIKQEYINGSLISGQCTITAADIIKTNKQPNFNTGKDALTQNGMGDVAVLGPNDEQAGRDLATRKEQESYDKNCRAYVATWIRQLAPCKYSQAALNEITAQLIQVCKEGSDREHPYGASSVKPSSSNIFRTFEEVVNDFNRRNNINNPLECNGYLITTPAPYDKQQANSNKTIFSKPADCECDKLTSLEEEYRLTKTPADLNLSAYLKRTRNISILQSDLTRLMDACNNVSSCIYMEFPIIIPPALQCYTGPACVTCTQVDTLYNRFTATYPGVLPAMPENDTIQRKKNQFFANYMNNKLGFGKEAWEYLAFRDSCRQQTMAGDTVCVSGPTNSFTYTTGNTDVINDIRTTSDNGYIMAGYTQIGGARRNDALVIKTDNKGQLLWAKTYGDADNEHFSKIKPTSDGGYIAIGNASLPGTPTSVIIAKLDASGNVTWARDINMRSTNGEDGRDILQLSNGNYAFSGNYNLNTNGVTDWMLGVLNTQGNVLWLKRMGINGQTEMGYHLVENADTLAMSGLTSAGVVNTSIFDATILKADKHTGRVSSIRRYDIENRKNEPTGFYRSGTGYKMVLMNSGDQNDDQGDAAIMDVQNEGTATGVRVLVRTTAGFTKRLPSMMTADNRLILSPGYTTPTDLYTYAINSNGTLGWANRVSFPGNKTFKAITQRSNGGFAGVGDLNGQPMLALLNSTGLLGCTDNPFTPADYSTTFTTNPMQQLQVDSLMNVGTVNNLPLTVTNINVTRSAAGCTTGPNTCYTIYRGPLLCGKATPVYENVDLSKITPCADSTFFAVNTATLIYKNYRDSVLGSFEQDYLKTCLQAADKELFSITHGNSEYHYTLYYYDQAGNLVKTVPPAGVIVDRTATWIYKVKAARAANKQEVPQHTRYTQYRYNTLNQIIRQKSPDGGMSQFWYDRLGRMAVSQNAAQTPDKYSYTLYDQLGRISEVGEITGLKPMTDEISRSAAGLQQWLNDATAGKTQIIKTVYDQPYTPIAPVMTATNLRNRVAWSALYNKNADISTGAYANGTFYSYDIHGNVATLLQDFKLGAMADKSNRFKKLEYDYDLISGKVNQVSYQDGAPDAFYHRYTYDAENRITNVATSYDKQYWENDAFYSYYKHGPLARTILGQQQVQGVDYAYTLQGWLKGVNSTALTPAFDMGGDGATGSLVARDAFGFALHYHGDKDYTSINAMKPFANASPANTAFKPLFNGNIAAMSVHIPQAGVPLLYTYTYDVLNRLSGMNALSNLNTATNVWAPSILEDFKEKIAYDPNGNILSYLRNGNKTFAGRPLEMDSFSYKYKTNTNQLDYITDSVDDKNYGSDVDKQTAGNYRYDAIGNLIADRAAGIDSIHWTVYGKIRRIKKSNGTAINYTYDVSGNRISKEVDGVQTWYTRDASGNVMSTYTFGDKTVNNGALSQTETHLYGSSRIGMSSRITNVQAITAPVTTNLPGLGTGINTTFTRGDKFFELSNHLGNVLAVVSDRRQAVSLNKTTVDHYEPVVTSAQDYYPFGSIMPGRNGKAVAGGWASGNTTVNGYTVPESLVLASRDGNQPSTYVASNSIEFNEGFNSSTGDLFEAYIADGSYTGGGSGDAVNGGKGYRYGFNGKENDNEVKGDGNQQDYGMRVYDPRVGKFLSVDPLTQEYPWYSPYQFAGNTPIQAIDLDGAEEELTQFASALKQKVMLQMDNAYSVKARNPGMIRKYEPNWGAKWKSWNDSKPATHTWAIFSRLAFATVNDAKIAYSSFAHGKNHASGIDNVGITDYKERVGASLSTLTNFVLPAVESEAFKGMTFGRNVVDNSELALFRKGNTGAFSELEVPMRLKDVKNVAEKAGVGLKGVKIKIDRDVEKLASNFPYVASAQGKTITLFPKAFTDYETLVKTLGHERTHIMQYSIWGTNVDMKTIQNFENAAYGIENTFWQYYKKK